MICMPPPRKIQPSFWELGRVRPSLVVSWMELIPLDSEECILWPFGSSSGGYGRVTTRRRREGKVYSYQATTVVHERFVGPVSGNAQVKHLCDNPPCVNPRHLTLGSISENNREAFARGRRPRKLSLEQRAEIRASSEGVSALARRFGVARTTIYRVFREAAEGRL